MSDPSHIAAPPLPNGELWIEAQEEGGLALAEITLRLCQTQGTFDRVTVTGPSSWYDLPAVDAGYRRLLACGVTIHPGVCMGLDVLDDAVRWRGLADVVREACELTGNSTIILDFESAVLRYLGGRFTPNWVRMQTCLRALPRDMTYVIYPGVSDLDPVRQARQLRFIEACCLYLEHVELVTFGVAGHEADNTPNPYAPCDTINRGLGRPCRSLAYWDVGDWGWLLNEIPHVVALSPDPTIYLYPGAHAAADFVRYAHVVGYQQPAAVTAAAP